MGELCEGWVLCTCVKISSAKNPRHNSYRLQGVLNHHFSVGKDLPVSANLLVTGSVPAGSGLSSSAAMVVASTLAFLAVNGKVLLGLLKSFSKNHI